jgi:hypothetical protein
MEVKTATLLELGPTLDDGAHVKTIVVEEASPFPVDGTAYESEALPTYSSTSRNVR